MRGLAEQLLDPVRVLDAGQLHDDAALALAGDLRIDHARLVDPPAHDLDRLLHRRRSRASCSATGDRVSVIVPSGVEAMSISGRAGRILGATSGRSAATALGLRRVAQPEQHPVLVRLRLQRLVEDRRRPQRLAHASTRLSSRSLITAFMSTSSSR